MSIEELRIKADGIIDKIKNNGIYPKENTFIDFKLELKLSKDVNDITIFLRNFAKDILALANKDGGILFLGFNENKETGEITDIGLNENNIKVLKSIDLKELSDQFIKMFDSQINIDLKFFNIATRKFYYIIIEKHGTVLVPKSDFKDYDIKKGDIIYRGIGKNVKANEKTSEFNSFIESKVNAKNREFMQIWSSLLPEVFDINPKEILIINPHQNKVYGYNSKNNILESTDIEIDNQENAPINIILNAISAGEIGKITTDEGKPIYKLIGEINLKTEKTKEFTSMKTIHEKIKEKSQYNISNIQLKCVMKYLGWVSNESFNIAHPKSSDLNEGFSDLIWIETIDDLKGSKKIVFSPKAVDSLLEVVEDSSKHKEIFNDMLKLKTEKK